MASSKAAAKKPATRKATTRKKKASAKPKAAAPSARKYRALVVVESPTKAKTVKKYLGDGYIVKASVGHVKDLPKSRLAVDVEGDFAPQYETIRGKSKVLKDIRDAAREADLILLAPDPDREGEAIAWHIAEELGKRHAPQVQRIMFHEITQRAVREAVAAPTPLNRLRFESQQARRILDRIVGYQISPILWDKVRRGLSAGRVQSVAVRLIVERESRIEAFVPEESWRVDCALLGAQQARFDGVVSREGDEKCAPVDAQDAERVATALRGEQLEVESVTARERRRQPTAPLITSKLQQEAASRLRFTAKRTMLVAQQLYEGIELGDEGSVGLITYMRTDSTRLSADAVVDVRAYIRETYGPDALPSEPITYRSKKSAQDAHEAIRPTSIAYPPEAVAAYLTDEQLKLYRLIWRQFVACQMVPAVYRNTAVQMRHGAFTVRASGSELIAPGFLAAHGEAAEEMTTDDAAAGVEAGDDAPRGHRLPPLTRGDKVAIADVMPTQKFTQPPPRFNESSLVRELEEQGIGRPSTYATILSTIVTRGYVTKDEGRFYPTELGLLVTSLLLESFPKVMDVAFTAAMEEQLDAVETGEVDWVKLLREFYSGGFSASVQTAKTAMRDVKREEIPTEHICDKCGGTMMQKWGRNGSFLACNGYPQCRNTRDYKRTIEGKIELVAEQTTDMKCPTCQGAMVVKRGRYGIFLACQTYPQCKGTRPMSIGVDCPLHCGSYVAERRSKRGRVFYGCAGYPDCTFVSWDRPVAGRCPVCEAPYLLRKYTKKDGVTIRCSDKTCGYSRDPELDDTDAQAVA